MLILDFCKREIWQASAGWRLLLSLLSRVCTYRLTEHLRLRKVVVVHISNYSFGTHTGCRAKLTGVCLVCVTWRRNNDVLFKPFVGVGISPSSKEQSRQLWDDVHDKNQRSLKSNIFLDFFVCCSFTSIPLH